MKQLYAISVINEGMSSGCYGIIDDIERLEEALDKLLDGLKYTINMVDQSTTYAGVTVTLKDGNKKYLTVMNHKLNELLK